jgi:hypothetical protein
VWDGRGNRNKIHQTFSDQPKLVSELIDYLYSGQDEKMLTTVKLARLLCGDKDKRQKIADLVMDIENNQDSLLAQLDRIVHPKTVAIVGASATQGKLGRLFMDIFIEAGLNASTQ